MNIDTYISVSLVGEEVATSDRTVVQLRKTDSPNQTFGSLTIRDYDVMRLLRGEQIRVHFRMWEPPVEER